MFTYIAKKAGYKTQEFTNRRMALNFIQRGYTVEVFKDGKKIYLMKPIDKNEKV